MTLRKSLFLLVVACATFAFAPELYAISYDEGVNGDLSGTPATPTSWGTLDAGGNTLIAAHGAGDFDLLSFSVAPGQALASVVLNSMAGDDRSFAGMQSGAVWTEGLGFAINAANLLGWTHFGTAEVGVGAGIGDDILDNIGLGANAIGFTPPLPSGTYTILLQETAQVTVGVTMTFNVVPEPTTLGLGLLGLVFPLFARRR